MKPLFEQNAETALNRSHSTFCQRGHEYGDTWRHSQHLCLRVAYRKLTNRDLPIEFCNALASAVMVDMKYQRMEGGYKDDTLIDAIAYQAFHAEEMRNLLNL